MKIGIYNEPAGAPIGGTEYSVSVLAEALRHQHQVEIVHHRPSMTVELLAETFGLDLEDLRTRYVPYEAPENLNGRGRWSRYQQLKAWQANLSEPYDVFINFTHHMPPFCHANFGILMVLFPLDHPFNRWPWIEDSPNGAESMLRKRLRLSYYEWEWQKRFRSYRALLANSQFTKSWVRKRWRVDCQVAYPPVPTQFCAREKSNIILSVGRFAGCGVKKNQLELTTVFRRMVNEELGDWQYACVGTLGESVEDLAYFDEVRRLAPPDNTQLHTNVDRSKLRGLYERAKIFWHAAGFDSDESLAPESMEHFGIVTVEAMAAGCVPVAINRGGQSEIVEHGVSGFLWNDLDELADYTFRLIRNDTLRMQMSQAARARSQKFDRTKFVQRFEQLLKPALL
jgi:glycosyltransferase involved in cell wall biosynthesis